MAVLLFLPMSTAMESKIPKKQNGTSIVEVIMAVLILTALFTFFFVYVDPIEAKKKARDEKRLSDISALEEAINSYLLTNGAYPDQAGVLRKSTSPLPWISEDISEYIPRQPIDPINNETYYYSYKHATVGYEINVILEHYTEYQSDDGGDDNSVYEVGNDLGII